MPITTQLVQATALFMQAVRAQALLTRVANRDTDPAPAQRGDTVNVRLPVARTPKDVTPGHLPEAPQAAETTNPQLVLNRHRMRDMALTDKEFGEIEAGNVPQQMEQMVVDLVEDINADGYRTAIQQAGWTTNASPGTNPFATDEAPWRAALLQLDISRAPRAGRLGIFNPAAYWAGIALPNLAQADRRGDAANPLVTGEVIASYGAGFVSDQLVASQTTGALGAGALTVNGANAINLVGPQALSVAKGAGVNYAAAPGDVISIAGHARTYVIAAAATVTQGANTTITLTAPLERACVGGEAITLVGAGTTYANSLVMNAQGLMFSSRPLQDLESAGDTYSLTDAQTGLTLRGEIVRQHKQTALQIDCLWGWRVVRPLYVGRVLG
jgi:hypothetical protein